MSDLLNRWRLKQKKHRKNHKKKQMHYKNRLIKSYRKQKRLLSNKSNRRKISLAKKMSIFIRNSKISSKNLNNKLLFKVLSSNLWRKIVRKSMKTQSSKCSKSQRKSIPNLIKLLLQVQLLLNNQLKPRKMAKTVKLRVYAKKQKV